MRKLVGVIILLNCQTIISKRIEIRKFCNFKMEGKHLFVGPMLDHPCF